MIDRKGKACQVVFCDQCGQEIKDADDGNYEWSHEETEAQIFFTHKRCSNELRLARPQVHMAISLEVFPQYLSNNLKIIPEKARRAIEIIERIG